MYKDRMSWNLCLAVNEDFTIMGEYTTISRVT